VCRDPLPQRTKLRDGVARLFGLRGYRNQACDGLSASRDGYFLAFLDLIDPSAQPNFASKG
jgi:hypothetical protein